MQLGDCRLLLAQALLNASRLFLELLALVLGGSTDAEKLAWALLPCVPSIDAKAEAPVAVSAEDVIEFAVPSALDLAVAEAKAVVVSACAYTPTLSRKSARASLFVMVSPDQMPDVAKAVSPL